MRNLSPILSITTLLLLIGLTSYLSAPNSLFKQKYLGNFSVDAALQHVKNIAKKPHFLQNKAQREVGNYLISELKKIGISPATIEGFSIGDHGNLCKPKNILARIKGTEKGAKKGKALLLLTHYDSHPHSSLGASDAGSGVATILEGMRAFISQHKTPKNDIIVCFTDAEELGLNGAHLFVNQHPWLQDIGLILNFEARGSGGSSYMFIETNGKNKKLVQEFIRAAPQYPVANSLAYSIYKLLPNDTDLTVFRKHGNVNGFNFAFIDDHFDYHTANDTWQNLDRNSLTHQAAYLVPLLSHFAEIDLSDFDSEADNVYYTAPFGNIISYPFMWNTWLLAVAMFLFVLFLVLGFYFKKIKISEIGSGFLALLLSIGLTGGIAFGLSKGIYLIYPEFKDILQGFPYNGHYYIAATILIAITVFCKVYSIFELDSNMQNLLVAPILVWLVISAIAIFYLPGAGYFCWIVFGLLFSWILTIFLKKKLSLIHILFCIPAIIILTPFVASFPVALGLKILFVSAILTVLFASVLLPVLGLYDKIGRLGNFTFILAIVCLGISHYFSNFTENRQKPNSLVYFVDADAQKAFWASYDLVLDSWTKKHIDILQNVVNKQDKKNIPTKYNTPFSYMTPTKLVHFASAKAEITLDTILQNTRHIDLLIQPQRRIDRMDFFADSNYNFKKMSVNGVSPKSIKDKNGKVYNKFTKRWEDHLFTYHLASPNVPLEIKMQLHRDSIPKLTYYESSFDLLQNKKLHVTPRLKQIITKPFVVNDAIMISKSLDLEAISKSLFKKNAN